MANRKIELDFRIEWGYSYLYSRRHYHPVYRWDGTLAVDRGEITGCFQLRYPKTWFGPGHCAREIKLDAPAWSDTTRRDVSGIRCTAQVDDGDAVFTLTTISGGVIKFRAAELLDQGRLVIPAGPKYLGCNIVITRQGYLWFRPAAVKGEKVWDAADLPLPHYPFARRDPGWIKPGKSLVLEIEVPEKNRDFNEELLHFELMGGKDPVDGVEQQVSGYFPYILECDGQIVEKSSQFLHRANVSYGKNYMQLLEDWWFRFQAEPGRHTLKFTNLHEEFSLLLTKVALSQHGADHLELSLPPWALVNEPLCGSVFAVKPDKTVVAWQDKSIELSLVPGWNDFEFSLSAGGVNIPVTAGEKTGYIPAVYDLPEENPPVTVGYDMTVINHDDRGLMDWLLNYTWRTRMGNLIAFRSFLFRDMENKQFSPDPELLGKWAEYCRKHHLCVEGVTHYEDGKMIAGAGDHLHTVGKHEYPGVVYAFDPDGENASGDMKEAMEKFISFLKSEVDRTHKYSPKMAFGDASGGHRYCFMAGADFIRSETMVPHTQHLCSQARPAAEALGSGEWGVHIATQHAYQPMFENHHMGTWYLSLLQPWIMGANMIYDEDNLFQLFKDERQAWDDELNVKKRRMLKDFFRFAKTHPRRGKTIRHIAFLEGRYAAPFNGFICGSEQTPDYSVWGKFGNNSPEWGHRQPEKCRHLLDVLMPGASTHPMRQRFDKRRFYFSGTPYGDFDEVPVEADVKYLQQYKLLLNLGWNTMIAEDYQKLTDFVVNGGTLLTGIPQFSTHVRRDFLRDMTDLALWRDGDIADLCGIKVRGRGSLFSGQWNAAGRDKYPEVSLSALPNHSLTEDGECYLADIEIAGAETVIYDADSGAPLLTRFALGKGWVYTLTAWVYPGHEQFRETAAAILAALADEYAGDIRVTDDSQEVFWSVRQEPGARILSMLNTDWTVPGNRKKVTVRLPGMEFDTEVVERKAKFVMLCNGFAVEYGEDIHIEAGENSTLDCSGCGKCDIVIHYPGGNAAVQTVDFGDGTFARITPEII